MRNAVAVQRSPAVDEMVNELGTLRLRLAAANERAEVLELDLLQSECAREELQQEVAQLRENFAAVAKYAGHARAGAAGGQSPSAASVREALDTAERQFGDVVAVCDTARASANQADYARPPEVLEALSAIHDVVSQAFAARDSGMSMGGRWSEAFQRLGFKYAATESSSTMNLYGDERVFVNAGRRVRTERHLTLGGGDRKNCLQIYFHVEESARRVHIVYCGRHLRTAKY